jgi:pimeloyl-[acyl-carrier protein] methyl ester esterase
MNIYCERRGRGPDLVLIHGWGMHGGAWGDLPERLAQDYAVTLVDLPGHGRSRDPASEATLAALTEAVAAVAPPSATWVGWSLGGFVAMDAALRHGDRVARLVLVSSTPKFVASADWPHALTTAEFAGFAAGLRQDWRATLQRFLSLQAAGDETGRALLRRLRGALLAHGEPQPTALAAGLAVLERTDLRARLSAIQVPTLVLHGRDDRLARLAAGDYLASRIPGASRVSFGGAGHAPFLSQPQRFERALREFLQ